MKPDHDKRDEHHLIDVINLEKLFPIPRGVAGVILRRPKRFIHAVDDISFKMDKGEILALVGGSGSGKTTTGLCCTGLLHPSSGKILIDTEDISELAKDRKRRTALRRRVQMVFQDPYDSLNPRQTILDCVVEPLEVHKLANSKKEKIEMAAIALENSGLKPAASFFDRFPQDLSGGQRQRVVIASALELNPDFLVADEIVSMLDVSIRAEILNLLLRLRDDYGISILYITHDLATAAYLCDRVAVMYLGVIVEIGPTKKVLGRPHHPYTKALISAIPSMDAKHGKRRKILKGETPSPIILPSGCRFHPRCPEAKEECRIITPDSIEVEPGHFTSCILYD